MKVQTLRSIELKPEWEHTALWKGLSGIFIRQKSSYGFYWVDTENSVACLLLLEILCSAEMRSDAQIMLPFHYEEGSCVI